MISKRFSRIATLAIFSVVVLLNGCGGGSGGNENNSPPAPMIASVTVSPTAMSVSVAGTTQFTATAKDSSGNPVNGANFTWLSSDTTIATINNTGLATGIKAGTTNITAAANSITSSPASLTITQPYLTAIQVNPGTASVAAGRTQQFTAQGTFNNGVTNDVSSLVTWSSSTASVSTISSAGLAQSYSQGTSAITATFTSTAAGTVTGTTTFTVTSPALVSVIVTDANAVTPGTSSLRNASIAKGTGHQYLAYGIYSDGGVRNITNTATWASSSTATATIASTGRATSLAAGNTTITATDPSTTLSGSFSLFVTAATIASIVVYPLGQTNASTVGQTIAPHTALALSALGVFSDATRQDITADATWTSTTTTAATVSNATPKGVAVGVAAGSTQIQATFGTIIGAAPLVVSSATLTSITLTPALQAPATGVGVAVGSTLQMITVGKFSDGSTQTINLSTAWAVTPSNGSIATVSATGLVTGVATGSAMVTASVGGITGVTATAIINVQAIKSIAVAPAVPIVNPSILNIAQGTASQFIATATLADGTTQDLTASATWVAISPPAVSGTPPVATISDSFGSAGWVTGNAPGTAIIAAGFGGQVNPSSVTVTSATLKSIAVTPATANIALGTSQQYTATGTFSDTSTQNLNNQVIWGSSSPTVAVMSLTGLATSTGTGTTNVTATSNITTPATVSPVVPLTVH
jgi:trimeric autotransporter adhesin